MFFNSLDFSIIAIYCVGIIAIATYVSRQQSGSERSPEDYFLAGRSLPWWAIGASLIAANISAEQIIGMSGQGFVVGIAIATYELTAAIALIVMAKYFLPLFLKKQIYTMPQFLEQRFDKRVSLVLSFFWLAVYVFINLTSVLWLGSLAINTLTGLETFYGLVLLAILSLAYSLYGGLKASIFTDNIQMIVIGVLLFISFIYITSFTGSKFSFDFVLKKNPQLLSSHYIPNYTAGLTFFIAVAATNLFHQGNWQRVYAAKNYQTLKKSLIISFLIIIPIVFFMGFSGMVAFSIDPSTRPDLGFFSLLLKEQTIFLSLFVIILGMALTISTVDTLINAISSLVILDGKAVFNLSKKTNYLNFSKYIIIFLSFISFIIASKGFDILYLFLLADLFCCAFVLTVFLSFYDKSINENLAYISILIGLIGGFLLFPSPDFSKSLLVGIFIPKDLFPSLVSQSLLFLSFIVATFLPLLIIKAKKLHIS